MSNTIDPDQGPHHPLNRDECTSEPLANPEAAEATSSSEAVDAAFASDTLERLQLELRQANDRALRWQAELENFRKRSRREMEEERRYACVPLLVDILGVVDNLNRAIEAADASHQAAGLSEGVKMVANQLSGVLGKHHCHPVDAIGTPFDPHCHEALMEMPSDEFAAGIVCRVARSGYRLHERIVRPAQVLVSKGPGPEGHSASDTASADDASQGA